MIRMLRLNLVLWIGCCCCLLLQAPWVVEAGHEPPPNSNRPTQLEDIERDNLNSERQVYKKEAIAQQQQHGASSSQSNNHYSVQIQHHPGSTAGTH
uniref:Secreted protein n=1 Tax=Anopheles atroparvus TaxID=41427 RepID=A0AAG5CT16_ANOAO